MIKKQIRGNKSSYIAVGDIELMPSAADRADRVALRLLSMIFETFFRYKFDSFQTR